VFCENYHQIQLKNGIDTTLAVRWLIDYKRDVLSIYLPDEQDRNHIAGIIDLSRIERLILNPFYFRSPLNPLKPNEVQRWQFDFSISFALKSCPRLKTLAFNYCKAVSAHKASGKVIYATPIDEDFQAKVYRRPTDSYLLPRDIPSTVENAKKMQQWFDSVMESDSGPSTGPTLKFSICTFGFERERQHELVRLIPAFNIPCKAAFWTERPLDHLTGLKPVYFNDCDLEADAKHGVLLPRSAQVLRAPLFAQEES